MSKITKKILTEDFYQTKITQDVLDSGDVELHVLSAPVNNKGFIIVDPESVANRERMFYHDVVGNIIKVREVDRVNPKPHSSQDKVQINDTSLIFNHLAEGQSTTFFVEKTSALGITTWGGPIAKGIDTISVEDHNFTLTDGTTNYIYYKNATNEVKITTTETEAKVDFGLIVAEVVTASGGISSIKYRKHSLSVGNFIESLTKTNTNGLIDTYSIVYTDGTTFNYTVTNGSSISEINKTSESGLIDTYTVSLSNGTETTFDVKNGADIGNIEKTNTVGLVATYTVTMTNGETSSFEVINGDYIDSVNKTSSNGLVDTYTMTTTTGENFTFTVTNGAGVVDTIASGKNISVDSSDLSTPEVSLDIQEEVDFNNQDIVNGGNFSADSFIGLGTTKGEHPLGEDMNTLGIVVSLGSDGKLYKGGLFYGILQKTGITDEIVVIDKLSDGNQSGLKAGLSYGYNRETGEVGPGDDFIAIDSGLIFYRGNLSASRKILGLIPGEILKGIAPLAILNLHNASHNTDFLMNNAARNEIGQTFTWNPGVETSEYNINTFNLQFGSYSNAHVPNRRFEIFSDITKTTVLWSSGNFKGDASVNNIVKSWDISSANLVKGVEYYGELRRIDGSTSYYLRPRYDNTNPYPAGNMYINGVISAGNTLAFQVEGTYKGVKDSRIIPLRLGDGILEDENKVYKADSLMGDNYKGLFEGETDGYTDPYNIFGGETSPIYGTNIKGGIFTHPASELNRIKVYAEKVGTGSNLDMEIYSLDVNGDLDTKLGEVLGIDATGLNPQHLVTVGNLSSRSESYIDVGSITADRDSYYTVTLDQRMAQLDGLSSIQVLVNGVEEEVWETRRTTWVYRTFTKRLSPGDIIQVKYKVSNDSYTPYVYNTKMFSTGEAITANLGSIPIIPDTEYAFLLKGDGDATNHTIISSQINIPTEEVELWSNATQYYNRYAETVTIGTIPGTGQKKVRIKAEYQNSSGGRVYGYLRQNDVNILGPIGWNTTNIGYSYDEMEGDVDFDLGAVTFYSVSQGDSDYGYSKNHSVTELVKPDKGFTSSTIISDAVRDKIGLFSRIESDESRPSIDTTQKGLFYTKETLVKNVMQYLTPDGNITTTEAGNTALGIATDTHVIDLDSIPEGIYAVRITAAATADIEIPHTLGKIPKKITCLSIQGTNVNYATDSTGVHVNGESMCRFQSYYYGGTTTWLYYRRESTNSNYQSYGSVKTLDKDKLVISHIKESSANNTFLIFIFE